MTLEELLRSCVIEFEDHWVKLFPLEEFSYNNSYHSSVGVVHFETFRGRMKNDMQLPFFSYSESTHCDLMSI
ncbi:hypothetical protein LINGRAHAP2_LOCUS15003 [Linum grandiflorum]